MHDVLGEVFNTHGLESTGADMQRQLAAGYAAAAYLVEHAGGEVQSGRRGGNRAVDVRVDGLIVLGVALLGGAV